MLNNAACRTGSPTNGRKKRKKVKNKII